MKKLINIFFLVVIAVAVISCGKKHDANKDVDSCIIKLKYFNNTFSEKYKDSIISRDTADNKGSSEYDDLKKIANEYYELMNSINSAISDEKKAKAEGKKISGYEKLYIQALEERKEEIDRETVLFMDNLSKIEE